MIKRAAPNSRQLTCGHTRRLLKLRQNLLPKAIRTATAGLMLCGAQQSIALGLGELEHNSYIGQPLTATVEIIDTEGEYSPNEIKIRQVSAKEAAATLNLDILANNYRLSLSPVAHDGGLQIHISSRQPINEPFVDFILELSWSDGQVFREYTLLMDPPPIQPLVPTTQAATPSTNNQPPTPARTEKSAPQFAAGSLGSSYTIRSGDTLSQVAEQWRLGSNHSIAATKQWLFQNNPRAFLNGDPNQLMLGARLQLPTANNLPPADLEPGWSDKTPTTTANNIPLAPAEREVIQQARDIVATNQAAKPLSGKLHLGKKAIIEPAELEQMTQQQPNREIRELIHITQETADRIIRENAELRRRIEDIENSDYIKSMEQLIALQRDEIESLRASLNTPASNVSAHGETITAAGPMPAPAPSVATTTVAAQTSIPGPNQNATIPPASQLSQGQSPGLWFWILSGLSALLAMIIAALVAFRLGQRSIESNQTESNTGTITAPVIEDTGDDDLGPVSAPDDLGEEEIIPLQLDDDLGDEEPASLDDLDILPEDEELLAGSDNHPQTLQVPEENILDTSLEGLDSIILPEAETEELEDFDGHVDFSATLSSSNIDNANPDDLKKPTIPEDLPFSAEELEDSELSFDLELNEDFVDSHNEEAAPAFDEDLNDIDSNLSALEENIFKDNRDEVDELISRAMIFASFGDYDKAEATLMDELALYPDEKRISDALEQFANERKKAEDQ